MHFWKAFFHIILSTALPYSPESETLGWMMELEENNNSY